MMKPHALFLIPLVVLSLYYSNAFAQSSTPYVNIQIVNNMTENGGGLSDSEIYVFVQSQTQVYQIDTTTFIASPVIDPTASAPAPSIALSALSNNNYSFYLNSTQNFTSGRIYFSDSQDAVQISSSGHIAGPSPSSSMSFDFIELTLNANQSINLDTSQIDQFGFPITLQVNPLDLDFPNGTGIVSSTDRASAIDCFQKYTTHKDFKAYSACIQTNPIRLLGPQHVTSSASELLSSFDDAVYNLFNYYTNHDLYVASNGTNSGMEIYRGRVKTDFTLPYGLTDIKGATTTPYTVFEFTGTGYQYDGANANLTKVAALTQGVTNVYQIFYPYFSTNSSKSPNNNALTPNGPPAPPIWWKAGWAKGNLPQSAPASNMVLACNGAFADNVFQATAYQHHTGGKVQLQDVTVLGNLENQLVTLLNRGIAPYTGARSTIDGSTNNLQLRTGYTAASDFNPIGEKTDTFNAPSSTGRGTTTYTLTKTPVSKNTISGSIALMGATSQVFYVSDNEVHIMLPSDKYRRGRFPYVSSGSLIGDTTTSIQFQWKNKPLTSNPVEVSYQCNLGNHYTTLHLIDPYNQNQYTYKSGDIGPATTTLTVNLKPGMKMTTLANFSQPMEVHSVDVDGNDLIIYSPIAFDPTTGKGAFNTGILTFGYFYPLDKNNNMTGQWNAYSNFFHNGNLGKDVPTIDGRGYAFPFDDNGGYSSDLNVNLSSGIPSATVTVTLLPLNKANK